MIAGRRRRPRQIAVIAFCREAVAQTLEVLDFLYICDKAPIPERGFSVAESPLRPAEAVPRGRRKPPLSISYNRVGLCDSHRQGARPSQLMAAAKDDVSRLACVPVVVKVAGPPRRTA